MSGFVYVIHSSSGLYKIGFSIDPLHRLAMLRTSTAESLSLLGVVPAEPVHERLLHRLLRKWRVTREWFEPCAAMQPLLDGLRPVIEGPKSAKTERSNSGREAVVRALDIVGTQARLASLMGCSQQQISYLLTAPNITAEMALLLDKATGGAVSKHSLRPDIFGAAA